MAQEIPKTGDYQASTEEARKAIEMLEEVDYAKLTLVARHWCKRYSGGIDEADDLLHDAITKTLNGTRKWNKSVTILRHLDRVMESDSSHIAEERSTHPTVALDEHNDRAVSGDILAQLDVSEELERIYRLFADDKEAMLVLRLKGRGCTASEIRRDTGISQTGYETITKRIRRHLGKYLTEGGQT